VTEHLRPLERRILALRAEGMTTDEIARRFNRSASRIEQIITWTEIPRSRPPAERFPRAIERRVLALRSQGESHERIGERFGRSARFIRQVEGLAHFRLARDLLR
jgi:DNA-binding CsgD family transcriptional regulator